MTFDFEKFPVYQLSLTFSKKADALLLATDMPKNSRLSDQLLRASLSISLNIAEGAGRFHKADKKKLYIMARGSVFECVAILDILRSKQIITEQQQKELYTTLEEISKMLAGLINSQK